MEKTYQDENDELLNFLLFNAIYPKFKEKKNLADESIGFRLNLYVTSTCNKNCEYCYLQKYENKLYPQEYNTPDNILNNLEIFCKYLTKNNIIIHYIDIFSGEIVGTPLFFDVLDILYKYAMQLQIEEIAVPTNASFLNGTQETIDKVQDYLDKFNQSNIHLFLSMSEDGGILDEINRPLKTQQSQDKKFNDFYNKLANFCIKNNHGLHPMVNAHNIDLWCDNLDWLIKYSKEKLKRNIFETAMFLEVRNDEWDEHALVGYINFLKHYIEEYFKSLNNEVELSNFLIFLLRSGCFDIQKKNGELYQVNKGLYKPFKIENQSRISCAYTQNFTVRLGDLAICPCHRLAYDHLIIGKYLIENNEIIGVKSNNIQIILNNYFIDSRGNMKCDVCIYNPYCFKGCHGAQYEKSKDINYPIESVCNLEKIKTIYIMINLLYYFNQGKSIPISFEDKKLLKRYESFLTQVQKEDKEFYNKWKKVIYQRMLIF